MFSSDFHNVLSCLNSFSFERLLEFGEQPEVARRLWAWETTGVLFLAKKKSESSARNVMFCHFPYSLNPTISLNTTSLKCFLPSTNVIESREKKIMYTYEGPRSPLAGELH